MSEIFSDSMPMSLDVMGNPHKTENYDMDDRDLSRIKKFVHLRVETCCTMIIFENLFSQIFPCAPLLAWITDFSCKGIRWLDTFGYCA